jgi:hypothetical protein
MKVKMLLVVLVLCLLFNPSASLANHQDQEKGPDENRIQDSPSVSIENIYTKALTSNRGRFVIGTTGGNPGSGLDDNKRLLYGYPTGVWSSFSSLRINDGGVISDYELGQGIDPVSPPTSDGTKLTTIWEQSGVNVTEYLTFVTNPASGYEDTVLIEYVVKNNNLTSRSAGIRIMLDVMVGSNDGAPYFIEGNGQVTQQSEWSGANVPEYWISYESPTFNPESVQGRGQLRGGIATVPDRFVIADWPQASGTSWDYTVNPSDSVTNDSAVILYFNPVYLTPGQSRTFRAYYGLNAMAESNRVELTGIEVTQGIQNLLNDVLLIKDRKTYVRAHVKATNELISGVNAELIARRPDGTVLPGSPVKPSNVGKQINVKVNPDRGQLNDSFYFEIDPMWLNGDIEFEVRIVDQTFVCNDVTDIANDCKASVSFVESPPAEVRLVGILFDQDDVEHGPETDDFTRIADQISATFPIPYLDHDNPYDIKPVFFAGPPTNLLHFIRINSMLKISRLMDGCGSSCQKYYLGVLVDQPTDAQLNGMADGIPSNVATAYITDRYTHPHELGHSVGQYHVLCNGNEAGFDSNYPYPNGHISHATSGNNAFYGFNTISKTILPPNSGDLMSYCQSRWTSDWTYLQLREKLVARHEEVNKNIETTLSTVFLVSGFVDKALNTGSFDQVYEYETAIFLSPPEPGTYTIRFEDNMGQEIVSYPFEPMFGVDSIVGMTAIDDQNIGSFTLLLPKPENLHRIVLLHGADILDTRDSSNSAPSVQVIYPNGGEIITGPDLTVTWNASDADGDPVMSTIQYSTDGGATWTTLATGVFSNSYDISTDHLPGTYQGFVRVIASDGLRTSIDTSDAVFSMAKHDPVARITSPGDNEFFVEDQTIIFSGEGTDNEDGTIDGSLLTWSSTLDGLLGVGPSITINATNMTAGSHTITLVAQDSDGQTGEHLIELVIYRDRPTLPISLSVAPETIQFVTFQGLGQSPDQLISIRNDGDASMTWTASESISWLSISSLSGTAPSNILASVNPAGLPSGEYQGTIAITAPSAPNSPQVINVLMVIREPYILNLPFIAK